MADFNLQTKKLNQCTKKGKLIENFTKVVRHDTVYFSVLDKALPVIVQNCVSGYRLNNGLNGRHHILSVIH